MSTVKERIEQLRNEVKKHDELYEQNRPIIGDGEYDKLYNELVTLEKEHPEYFSPDSPTQKIYTSVVSELEKVAHSTFMGSQSKVNDWEGIEKFISQAQGTLLVQHKLDGLTLVLHYENGQLVLAVTRGSGEEGENVTHTVRTIDNVPKSILFKGKLEIRMEGIIPYSEFERINVNGEYSNPRNLASGTLRQLNAKIAEERNLQGIVFEVIQVEGMTFANDQERLQFLSDQGFTVVPTKAFSSDEKGLEELKAYIEEIETVTRKELPYMIDGLIIKYDNLAIREQLGSRSKSPRWSVAYKFEAQEASTKLLGVTNQVGKSGQITPVAELQTVNIEGVNISRATLHNYGNISEKDIRIGDTVMVIRANDVIPKITSSVKEVRSGEEAVITAPTNCPVCNSPTEWEGANLFCTGVDCMPQLKGKIEHFGSRKALNIDGLGEKTVALFFEKGIIQHFLDLYRLEDKRIEILSIEGFGQKKLDKLLQGLENAKSAPLHKVLYALSIRHIGETSSRDMARAFANMSEILEASKEPISFSEKIRSINDFGDTMTRSVVDFFTNPQNRALIEELQRIGFTMESEQASSGGSSQEFEGKVFVITGSLSKSRDEFKALIEQKGGKVSGSVSKKTNYLLMGEDAEGTSKHKKALEVGTTILSEEDFNKLIS